MKLKQLLKAYLKTKKETVKTVSTALSKAVIGGVFKSPQDGALSLKFRYLLTAQLFTFFVILGRPMQYKHLNGLS